MHNFNLIFIEHVNNPLELNTSFLEKEFNLIIYNALWIPKIGIAGC